MATQPDGDAAVYCSADINLVGAVVKHATGTWLPDIFQRDFAQPLQISRYYLNLMPTGDAYMGGGLYMRPRDLLKLGQLYLNGGVWNGKRGNWQRLGRVVNSRLVEAARSFRPGS